MILGLVDWSGEEKKKDKRGILTVGMKKLL